MKTLIILTASLSFFFQTIAFGQTEKTSSTALEQKENVEKQQTKVDIATQNDEKFIGTYTLVEANLELKIIKEDGQLYLVSEFSKDILIPKNPTTVTELTRGVDLALIADDTTALKFTQNGYETTIKRVETKEQK